jgi:hypothetical protein
MTARSFLFLGCSLEEQDAPVKVLAELKRRMASLAQDHFALRDADCDVRAEERRFATLGVRPIFYTGKHNECLRQLLTYLVGSPRRSGKATNLPIKERSRVRRSQLSKALDGIGGEPTGREPIWRPAPKDIPIEAGYILVLRLLTALPSWTGALPPEHWRFFADRIIAKGLDGDLKISRNPNGEIKVTCDRGYLAGGERSVVIPSTHRVRPVSYRLPADFRKRGTIGMIDLSFDNEAGLLQVSVGDDRVVEVHV